MPDLTIIQVSIAIFGGLIAGFINTLAGNGSAITLTILTEILGLPGNMANGSNRVGVLFQSSISTYTFYRNDRLNLSRSSGIIIWTTIGAIVGVIVAINVSNEQFMSVFKYLMILMLVVVLVKPKRWLIETQLDKTLPFYVSAPLFFALGFYGGFIQMGMGVVFLIVMVLIAKYSIIDTNAVKVFVVFLYTIFVIAIFQYKGLIDWKLGGIIAIGQGAGGYLAAKYASTMKNANLWAYRLLILIMVFALLKLFGAISW